MQDGGWNGKLLKVCVRKCQKVPSQIPEMCSNTFVMTSVQCTKHSSCVPMLLLWPIMVTFTPSCTTTPVASVDQTLQLLPTKGCPLALVGRVEFQNVNKTASPPPMKHDQFAHVCKPQLRTIRNLALQTQVSYWVVQVTPKLT